MYIPPKALSNQILPAEVLRPDRVCCTHYEDFGLGDKALYVGMYGFSRVGYIPFSAITRVYKRLGVTKGFFEQGKIYGTLCYLTYFFFLLPTNSSKSSISFLVLGIFIPSLFSDSLLSSATVQFLSK